MKTRESHIPWRQVSVYGDIPPSSTCKVIENEGGVFSQRAKSFFLIDLPNTSYMGMPAYLLRIMRISAIGLGFREPATIKKIAEHAQQQGLIPFTPQATLQIIHKHTAPMNGDEYVFVTKVGGTVVAISLEDAHGKKRIDVKETNKRFPIRNSSYTFLFCM